MKVSRDTPLSEITFRRYEKPSVSGRELVKKICLSLGLLQPGDSRDVVVDVLQVLLAARKAKKRLSCTEIELAVIQNRKRHKLELLGIASSNIRRQLRRIKEMMLIEKVGSGYRIVEFMALADIFEQKVERYLYQTARERILEYLAKADEDFGRKKA